VELRISITALFAIDAGFFSLEGCLLDTFIFHLLDGSSATNIAQVKDVLAAEHQAGN
jgi:hypothetical protein